MQHREMCLNCRKARKTCYCHKLEPFYSVPLVILIHPKEARKRINTGRMAHLSLTNSYLLEGTDFCHSPILKKLRKAYQDRTYVLFPGPDAIPPSRIKYSPLNPENEPLFIIIDGTWSQAKKMLKANPWLDKLPQISLRPAQGSTYTIRKQPRAECLSTIESIHQLLAELDPNLPGLGGLLPTFHEMVSLQLAYEKGLVYRSLKNYENISFQ